MNRRSFLRTSVAAASVGSLAGCLGGDSEESGPEPVDLSGGKFDDDHGMEIGPHGGANGQIFYEEQTPPDREGGPFWFHTLVFSLFPFHFDRRDRGWEADVIYVTDFSAIDWTVQERDRGPTMPSPTAPETFAAATDLTYVAESSVMGGMGPGLHPFSDGDEAASFVDDHGGETLAFGTIDRALVETLQESNQ
ncbi:MAG: nitrous oxide reductase accessory protein NosL [Halovenus sp.]